MCTPCDVNHYSDTFGAAHCESCGVLINATEDRTECDTEGCLFYHPSNRELFNLTMLNRVVNVEDSGFRYTLSICSKLPVASQCFDKNHNLLNRSHVCQVQLSDGIAKSSGDLLNVYFERMESLEVVKLKFTKVILILRCFFFVSLQLLFLGYSLWD